MSQTKQEIKCKKCSIQGLEWYTNKEGKYRLRFVSDKVDHTMEECQNIQQRKDGYSWKEIIQMHKNNASTSSTQQQQQQQQNTEDDKPTQQKQQYQNTQIPPPAGKETAPQEYVTKAQFESEFMKLQLKISEFVEDFWKQNSRLFNSLSQMRESMKYIPGFTQNMNEDINNTFKTGSEIKKEQEGNKQEITQEERSKQDKYDYNKPVKEQEEIIKATNT